MTDLMFFLFGALLGALAFGSFPQKVEAGYRCVCGRDMIVIFRFTPLTQLFFGSTEDDVEVYAEKLPGEEGDPKE